MMAIALAFLRVAWPYLLAGVVLGVGIYRANHWCNSVCKEARSEVEQLQAEKKAAQERATAITMLWAAQVDKTEAEARKRRESNETKFAGLGARARALPAAAVRVSAAAAGLLDDVSRAANAAAAPGGGEAPAEAVPQSTGPVAYDEREFAQYIVLAGQAYADAVNQWRSCVNHYERLAEAQQQEKPP